MSGFIYTLSFNEMCQSKVDTGIHKKRNIRRRPKFQPTKDSKYELNILRVNIFFPNLL